MKQLYLTPYMTVICVAEDVLTTSEESDEKTITYKNEKGEGDSVAFAG